MDQNSSTCRAPSRASTCRAPSRAVENPSQNESYAVFADAPGVQHVTPGICVVWLPGGGVDGLEDSNALRVFVIALPQPFRYGAAHLPLMCHPFAADVPIACCSPAADSHTNYAELRSDFHMPPNQMQPSAANFGTTSAKYDPMQTHVGHAGPDVDYSWLGLGRWLARCATDSVRSRQNRAIVGQNWAKIDQTMPELAENDAVARDSARSSQARSARPAASM